MTPDRRALALRVALTVTAMEFFGPTLRDAGASHALDPDWVGHARVHLVWLLGFATSILAFLPVAVAHLPISSSLGLLAFRSIMDGP